jgi:hypothetical protein
MSHATIPVNPAQRTAEEDLAKSSQETLIANGCRSIYTADYNRPFASYQAAFEQLLPYHVRLYLTAAGTLLGQVSPSQRTMSGEAGRCPDIAAAAGLLWLTSAAVVWAKSARVATGDTGRAAA